MVIQFNLSSTLILHTFFYNLRYNFNSASSTASVHIRVNSKHMQAGSFCSSLLFVSPSLSLRSLAYNCNCYRRLSKRRLLWLGTAAHASLLTISLEASLESLGSAGSGNASSGFCCIIVRHSRGTPRSTLLRTPLVEASRDFGKEAEGETELRLRLAFCGCTLLLSAVDFLFALLYFISLHLHWISPPSPHLSSFPTPPPWFKLLISASKKPTN